MRAPHESRQDGPRAPAEAILVIDPQAVVANWRDLRAKIGTAECAAVVKADAYGLGMAQIAAALHRAGCRSFFAAHLDEAIALRRHLGAGPTIRVLHGPPGGAESAFCAHALTPVLNSLEQAAAWRMAGGGAAVLQVDTGMNRLGVRPEDWDAPVLRGLPLVGVISHLACADTPAHPANTEQRGRFAAARARFGVGGSLAASAGIFLGSSYHFDAVRPGAALYGLSPVAGANPMRPVLRLSARVIQVRDVPAGESVGYGLTWMATRASRVATVAIGYADGVPRRQGGRGAFRHEGQALPVIGRVSMDSITLDVTEAPRVEAGALIEVIGPHRSIDDAAQDADTIGYELLTSLGARFERVYGPLA